MSSTHRAQGAATIAKAASREVDQVSIDMARAKAAVDTTLRPYLLAPAFGEFLFSPELLRVIRRDYTPSARPRA